jgi:hypothetical protein
MTQQPFEHVSFGKPDEVREGENWRLDLVNLAGGAQVGRLTIQPGFRWTKHVKPVAGTELCMAPHQQYHVAGRIHIVLEDGRETEAGPGEILALPRATMPGWSAMRPRSRLTGWVRPSGGARCSAIDRFVVDVAGGKLCACPTRTRRLPTSICARPI